MPSQSGSQRRPPILDVHNVAGLPQPVVEFGASFSELLAGCLSTQQKQAFAVEAAIVSKAQKVERVGLAALPSGVLTLVPAKTNRPGLFRVKTQSEFRKSFSKHRLDFPGALPVLHHANEIVRIAYQIAFSANAALDSLDKPQVQYIM